MQLETVLPGNNQENDPFSRCPKTGYDKGGCFPFVLGQGNFSWLKYMDVDVSGLK